MPWTLSGAPAADSVMYASKGGGGVFVGVGGLYCTGECSYVIPTSQVRVDAEALQIEPKCASTCARTCACMSVKHMYSAAEVLPLVFKTDCTPSVYSLDYNELEWRCLMHAIWRCQGSGVDFTCDGHVGAYSAMIESTVLRQDPLCAHVALVLASSRLASQAVA